MKKIIKKISQNYSWITIIAVWVIFSSPVLFFNKTPYPSNYQMNFFAPWSVYPELKGPVKNAAQPDIITQIYPWRNFTIQELKAGRIPFWNPYSFAGTPHLANYQSAVFFPLNILFFLPIAFIDAWNFLVILQVFFAGIFMHLLMQKLRVSQSGSLISAISFMFCGFVITWLGYATLGYAILVLPLAIYLIEQFVDTKKYKWLAFIALSFPLSYFAGHFQTSIYFTVAVFSYIIYKLFLHKDKRTYLLILVSAFVGLLLTMPQVLPSLELYYLSVRSELFIRMEAIPLQYLITLFSPDFFGNPVTRNDWFGHYAEWNGYAGVIGVSLALFTTLFKRNRTTAFFILLALVSLLLAVDTPLNSLLVTLQIPVLSTSAAGRIIVLFSFSVAVLAGFGIDSLRENIKNNKRILVWLIFTVGLFSALSIIGLLSIKESEKMLIAQKNSILPILILVSLLGASVLSGFVKKTNVKLLLSIFIVVICVFEMYRFAAKWQNFDPKEIVYRDVPIGKFYNSHNHYDRVIGLSGAEDAIPYRIPVLGGYDPLYKEEYGEFVQFIGRGEIAPPERSVIVFPYSGMHTPQAVNFLGVKHIVHKVSDGTFPWAFPFPLYPASQFTKVYDDSLYLVFQNNSALERSFIVGNVKKMEHVKIPHKMMTSDVSKIAFVENDFNVPVGGSGSARITQYLPTKVFIETNADNDAFLVLTDNYYPGWSVKVNDEKSEIYKTNYSFRGVVIPKGKSIVEFSYTPMSFLIGMYLFLLGGMVFAVLFVLRSFSRSK